MLMLVFSRLLCKKQAFEFDLFWLKHRELRRHVYFMIHELISTLSLCAKNASYWLIIVITAIQLKF